MYKMGDKGYFDYRNNPLVRVFMNKKLKEHHTYTKALYQLGYASSLGCIIEPVVGLPDLTPAYGLPVGGVLATDAEKGVIALNAVGGDIGCGISLSQTNIDKGFFFEKENLHTGRCKEVSRSIKDVIESDSGSAGDLYMDAFVSGAGLFAGDSDVLRTENYGKVELENIRDISEIMRKRAEKQLGTLGAGNHFIDLLYCSEVFDNELAVLWGIDMDSVLHMVHTGSRGVGSAVRERYSLNTASEPDKARRIFQPRKFDSEEGRSILNSVSLAINYAYANRARMRQMTDMALAEANSGSISSELVYDFMHNSISVEEVGGSKAVVHRKGAAKALPPGHSGNTDYFMETGHPIIIPGSLGTPTYILAGTEKLRNTHLSINHGAGRKYPRGYVRKKSHHPRFRQGTENVFVNLRFRDYCDEMPEAYKDIEEIIDTLEINGLVRKVAKLQPFFVFMEKEQKRA